MTPSRRTPSDESVEATNMPVDPNANVAGVNMPVDPSVTLNPSAPTNATPEREEFPLAHGPNADHLEQQAVASHTRAEPRAEET